MTHTDNPLEEAMSMIHRRPSPFSRLTRPQLEAKVGHVEQQRDRALGKARATTQGVAAWLESRAAGYLEDARHMDRLKATPTKDNHLTAEQRRAIAHELQQCAIDFEARC